jgi:hypothetical protein
LNTGILSAAAVEAEITKVIQYVSSVTCWLMLRLHKLCWISCKVFSLSLFEWYFSITTLVIWWENMLSLEMISHKESGRKQCWPTLDTTPNFVWWDQENHEFPSILWPRF